MQDKGKYERLTIALEEMSEAIVELIRINKYGDVHQAEDGTGIRNNRRAAEVEIGQVLAALSTLVIAGDIDIDVVLNEAKAKVSQYADINSRRMLFQDAAIQQTFQNVFTSDFMEAA